MIGFILTYCSFVSGQNTVKIELGKDVSSKTCQLIKLFKYNPKNFCDQSKGVSIVFDNKISPCFDHIKTFDTRQSKKIVGLLRSVRTYGSYDAPCFDTDYALMIYNKSNKIVGHIEISFSCNKLISEPNIKEREHFNHDGLRNVGFSKSGRKTLIKLLMLDAKSV